MVIFSSSVIVSSSCDKDFGEGGCTDTTACNFNQDATTDDGSCWFANQGCACSMGIDAELDCLKVCDSNLSNNPPDTNNDGICDDGVIVGCLDTLACNYNSNATHNNDSCAIDLSNFGGSINGKDCDGNCFGLAVEDACGLCIGGEQNLIGKSWAIGIDISVLLSDGSILDESAHLGASVYAKDTYNNLDIEEANCNGCYLDIAEQCGLGDSLCFYFPHDDWEISSDSMIVNSANFDKDIRRNNLYDIYSNGMQWDSEIFGLLSDTLFIDSLYIDFIYSENIESCRIKVNIDYIDEFEVQNQQVRVEINSNELLNVTFNI